MRHALWVPIALASLSVACAGQDTEQEYLDAVTADPDHYSVEFENDVARVVRIAYGPGETSVMHRHPPNCAIFLRDQPGTMESPDGTVSETVPSEAGTLTCTQGEVHLPTNTSDAELELVLVEFKEGATAGPGITLESPDAVIADPDHYEAEFENEAVRMIRILYQPGESSVMHSHAANCVVWLAGQPASFGQVECTDSQEHEPAGATDGPTELVAIEFKGRATLND